MNSSGSSSPSAFGTYRERLYEIRDKDNSTSEETLEDVLALGCEYLDPDNGHIKRIDRKTGTHEVIASYSETEASIAIGDIHQHDSTYCRFTVDQQTPFAMANATEQGYTDDPAYREHGLECYLGESFAVGGSLYGTVCFVSQASRSQSFSAEERSFVELLARTVAKELRTTTDDDQLEAKSRAVEDAAVAISIADATTSPPQFSYVNKQFEQLLGYARETLIDEDYRILIGRKTSEEKVSVFNSKIEHGTTYQDEIYLSRQDGSHLWVQLTVTPVHDEGDQISHYISFYQDITQRQRNERLLSVLNRIVRHNVRNKLCIVDGYVELLASETDMSESSMVKHIFNATNELVELSYTAKLLEKSRQEAKEPEMMDIVPVVSNIAEQLRADAPESSISVTTPDEQRVFGTSRIHMALQELAENALKYAGENPSVDFVVEPVPGKNFARISVRDDGPGLPEPDRQTLEGRPETPLKHGSGLGLFLVYWIVTAHGGNVSVSTEDGTVVDLNLRTVPTQPSEISKPMNEP